MADNAVVDESRTDTEAKPTDEAKPGVKLELSAEVEAEVDEVIRLLKKGEAERTKANLMVAKILVGRISKNVIACAHVPDDIKGYREQSLAIFATDRITQATGQKLDSKKLTEFVRAHYLVDVLSVNHLGTAYPVSLRKLSWETIRVLVRWAEHLPNGTDFVAGESYTESWRIKPNCEVRLTELIDSFVSAPKGRKVVAELLDDHEAVLDAAALKQMLTADRIAEEDRRETEAHGKTIRDRNAFFAGIVTRAATLGLSLEELSNELRRLKILKPLPGEFNVTKCSRDDAYAIAMELARANNWDAIGAMNAVFAPIVAEDKNNFQPSKGTGDIIGRTLNGHSALAKSA